MYFTNFDIQTSDFMFVDQQSHEIIKSGDFNFQMSNRKTGCVLFWKQKFLAFYHTMEIELKVAYVKQIPNLTISFLHVQIRPILLENYTT